MIEGLRVALEHETEARVRTDAAHKIEQARTAETALQDRDRMIGSLTGFRELRIVEIARDEHARPRILTQQRLDEAAHRPRLALAQRIAGALRRTPPTEQRIVAELAAE